MTIAQAQSPAVGLRVSLSGRSQGPSSSYGCGGYSDSPVRGAAAIHLTSATGLQLLAAARVAADGDSAVARPRRMSTMSKSRLVYAVHAGIVIAMICDGRLRFI